MLLPAISVWIASWWIGEDVARWQWLVFPAFVIMVSALGTWYRVARLLTSLIAITAIGSVLIGAILQFGTMPSSWRTDDKALIGGSILAGPYSHSNALGLVLSVGLPLALWQLRGFWRLFAVFSIYGAILWTGSRSAIFAGAVLALLWFSDGFGRGGRLRPYRFATLFVAIVLFGTLLPLTVSDPASYTNRGAIWQASLDAFDGSPVFGLGVDAYGANSVISGALGSQVAHGHSLVVNSLVTSGVVGLIAIGGLLLAGLVSGLRNVVNAPARLLLTLSLVASSILKT